MQTKFKAKPDFMTFIRELISITISLIVIFLIPAYGLPFGGCDKEGYFSFSVGCSLWPEFIRGAVVILVVSIFSKHKLITSMLLTVFLVIISAFGGLYSIRNGDHWDYLINHWYRVDMYATDPLLHGAITIYSLLLLFSFVLNKSKNQ